MKTPTKMFMGIAAIAGLIGYNSSEKKPEQKDEVSGHIISQTNFGHVAERIIDCDVGSVSYWSGRLGNTPTAPNTEKGQETVRQICAKNGVTPGF